MGGRARMIVEPGDVVTINGHFKWAPFGQVLVLVGNGIVMCTSSALLLFAMYARSESAFMWSLGGDAASSVLCFLTFIFWVAHHSQMDPDRNVPLIVLCGSQ